MALVEHPGDSGHWQRRSVWITHILSGARASLVHGRCFQAFSPLQVSVKPEVVGLLSASRAEMGILV